MIINAFENTTFPFYPEESRFEDKDDDDDDDDDDIRDKNGLIDYKELDRLIFLKERNKNNDLVKEYFLDQNLATLLKKFKRFKNTEIK